MKTNQESGFGHVHRELLVKGVKFDYERLTFTASDGRTTARECVRHPGAVILLPVLDTPEGARIILIRNWRLSLEHCLFELPAGTLAKGEDPAACASRELEEETGYRAANLRPLCRFHTSPGLSDELMHAFVADDLRHVGQRLEADERITVHPTPIPECLRMVRSGEITDAKTMLTILWAWQAGIITPPCP